MNARWARCLRALAALLAWGSGLLWGTAAWAQAAEEVTPPVFEVHIQAPESIHPTLTRHLDILRYRTLADLTAAELAQLADEMPANVRSLLGALGHFSPQVEVTRVPATTTAPAQVRVQVDPGPVAHVASVNLTVHPPGGATAPADPALTQRVAEGWPLPEGTPFTQAAWDDAKAQALARLTRRDHPAARLDGSLADVDAETAQVHLHLAFDSGPTFTLGPVQVDGLQRYEADWVRRIAAQAGLSQGQPYDLATLQEAQQQLAQSGYFESVYVHVDPNGPAEGSPVHVQVREARRGKLVLGVGGSTDSGARLSAEHTVLRLPGLWDARVHSQLKLERDTRSAQTAFSLPLEASGWRWTSGLKAERLTEGGKTTANQQFSLGRARDTTHLDRRLTLQVDQSRVRSDALRAAGLDTPDLAISLHHRWQRRQYDALPFPSEGHTLTVETGAGWVIHPTRRPFARATVRWQGLWPLTAGPGAAPAGRIAYRAEGGAVVAADSARVPEAMRFLAGGDQSVRGYPLRSIGVPSGSGTVTAGRWMATGSLEWQRPWAAERGTPSPWETTVFADVGAVADRARDLRAHWGVGAGVRYRTPVGPIQADLAYGVSSRKFRLHVSAGFVF